MKAKIPKLTISNQYLLRKCGYLEIRNPHKDFEISYARSLDPGRFYPRFHVYLEEDLSQTRISLHLDAKKPSYEGTAAHGGEYQGELVEKEMERIMKIAGQFTRESAQAGPLGFKPEKSFWGKLKTFFKK